MAPGNRPAPAPAPAAPLASAPAAVASAPPPPATVPPAARIGESRRLREPRAVAGTVPAGARLSIALTRSLTSRGSRVGERVYARVASPVYAHGVVVVPRGAEVIGVVTQAGAPRRLGGRATLGVRFTSLVLPSGARVPIQGSFVAHGRNRSRRSAAIVGGSAAGGAILGHNIHRGNRGTLIGALLGAAAGSAVAANVPGPDVVIPRGTVVRVKLRRAVRI